MKPVIASKPTTCHKCGETIERGERRLDDVITIGKMFKGQPKERLGYKRVHWHPYCWEAYCVEYFKEHKEPPKIEGRGRQKILNLTPEQKALRHKTLVNLRALAKYHQPLLVEVMLAANASDLTTKHYDSLNRFIPKYTDAMTILTANGGIPNHLRTMELPLLIRRRAELESMFSDGYSVVLDC